MTATSPQPVFCTPSLEEVWALRHTVMYPDKALAFVQLPEDADGTHFGFKVNGQLVSVVSVFIAGDRLQFRKLATAEQWRERGLGSRLLQAVFQFGREKGVEEIGCNARTSACGLYRKFGMQEEGATWHANGFEYTKMKIKI